eukprot:10075149-Lingulodinium_polyedra.AAC.1
MQTARPRPWRLGRLHHLCRGACHQGDACMYARRRSMRGSQSCRRSGHLPRRIARASQWQALPK